MPATGESSLEGAGCNSRAERDASATGEAVHGSDAVFAAVAAAVWIHEGRPQDWPTRRGG
jgi:hypothetical protein